ncbi:MAG TPA: GntR family transcriptional regulator [Devosiaceae bacterium]|jgi:DNA-binding GntR family transcriptional regulator
MKSAASPYQFLPPPPPAGRGGVTAYVTNALRQAIVTLELRPGEVIDKGAVCDRLGISRFPVSEALARLQAEGLVDIQPQRGSIVSLVRIADVREYMIIRKALESEAVRALVAAANPEVLGELRQVMARQEAAAAIGDRTAFHAHDLQFHDVLFEALRFARIKTVIENARANLDRARRLIITPRRLADTISEHRAIYDAIAGGDADAAAAAMRAHIDSVMAELFTFAGEKPDLFADGDSLALSLRDTFPFG